MVSARMGPLRYPGPEANRWLGMLLSLTLMQTHINSTSTTAGAAANHAATAKSAKYANLTSTHIFVPFVIETQVNELIQEIGRRTQLSRVIHSRPFFSFNVFPWPSSKQMQSLLRERSNLSESHNQP